MKLEIDLTKRDLRNIKFVLNEIADKIEDGFTSGVGFPVNWQFRKSKETPKMNFME